MKNARFVTIRHPQMRLLLLLSVLSLLAIACSSTVYVVQNPDGTFTEVEPIQPETNVQTVVHDDDLVIIDVLPSNDFVLVDGSDGPLYLQVTVGARETALINRSPLNVSIVLDRSGSMSGQKMRDAREAAVFLVDHLADGDRVSVVSYSSEVTVDVPSVAINSDNRHEIIAAIDRISSGGNTFLSGGLEKGGDQVSDGFDAEFLNRVVLLSDGLANEGVTDTLELGRMADKLREEGITVSTMGVGYDYNEDLMANLAVYGGGNYYFIESSNALATTFGHELDALMGTVVRDAVLIIELPPEVRVQDVFGYQFEQRGNELEVHMNSVSAGEERRLLVSLDVPRSSVGKQSIVKGGSLDFRNEAEKRDESVAIKPLTITVTDQKEEVANNFNVPVMRKVEAVKNAIAREEVMHHLDAGNGAAARQVVKQRVEENRASSIMFEDDDIAGELGSMEEFKDEVEAAPAAGSKRYKKMRKSRKKEAVDALAY